MRIVSAHFYLDLRFHKSYFFVFLKVVDLGIMVGQSREGQLTASLRMPINCVFAGIVSD